MASYDDDLLAAAGQLLLRDAGRKGTISRAHVRRSVSTTYYALFHFILDEVGRKIIGSTHALQSRRRIFSRTISHKAVRVALDKVRGANVDSSVEDFFRPPGSPDAPVRSPPFVRGLAGAFLEAQGFRHEADYDLNKSFSEADALRLRSRVCAVIEAWRQATDAADRDFKHTLCVLIVLRGQTRSDI